MAKTDGAIAGGTGAAIALAWIVRSTTGAEMPLEVAAVIVGGAVWLAYRLTDRKGRHERGSN